MFQAPKTKTKTPALRGVSVSVAPGELLRLDLPVGRHIAWPRLGPQRRQQGGNHHVRIGGEKHAPGTEVVSTRWKAHGLFPGAGVPSGT